MPDCDETCRCRWQRRLASRTPFLQSSAVLHRLFEDKGQSSASSTWSSSSSFSPPRSLRIKMLSLSTTQGGEDFQIMFQKEAFEYVFFFTNDWLSTIKQRGIPLNHTGVLANAEDSGSLGRIGNIWGENMAHVIREKNVYLHIQVRKWLANSFKVKFKQIYRCFEKIKSIGHLSFVAVWLHEVISLHCDFSMSVLRFMLWP